MGKRRNRNRNRQGAKDRTVLWSNTGKPFGDPKKPVVPPPFQCEVCGVSVRSHLPVPGEEWDRRREISQIGRRFCLEHTDKTARETRLKEDAEYERAVTDFAAVVRKCVLDHWNSAAEKEKRAKAFVEYQEWFDRLPEKFHGTFSRGKYAALAARKSAPRSVVPVELLRCPPRHKSAWEGTHVAVPETIHICDFCDELTFLNPMHDAKTYYGDQCLHSCRAKGVEVEGCKHCTEIGSEKAMASEYHDECIQDFIRDFGYEPTNEELELYGMALD